jgi:hypothetical protein
METYFTISNDLEAFLEPDGAGYTGNLIIRSESLDDYDIYEINNDKEWDIYFDSLTNRTIDDQTNFDKLDLPDNAKNC